MIKAIVFDFDGVLVESADIKTNAFRELFSDYPQKLEEIIDYHLLNAGISRYVKFRYIYEQILGKELTEDEEIELGRRFSQIVLQKILSCPLVAGAKEFLDKNKKRYRFFIASGTPQDELNKILRARGLRNYFQEIQGSPNKKTDIINQILNKYNFSKNELIYVGDARSDHVAAEETGVFYIERRADLGSKTASHSWVIKDLLGLDKILEEIQKLNFKEVD